MASGEGPEEGALVARAGALTAEQVAFMVRHTSGLLCVAMTDQRADSLNLPELGDPRYARGPHRYAVSVDARDGITTGISAVDRARTITLLARADTRVDELSRPGHVVTVRVSDGERALPLTHAPVALLAAGAARQANGNPDGPLSNACAVYAVLTSDRDPTRTADAADATEFARRHAIPLVHVADLATVEPASVQHRAAPAAAYSSRSAVAS